MPRPLLLKYVRANMVRPCALFVPGFEIYSLILIIYNDPGVRFTQQHRGTFKMHLYRQNPTKQLSETHPRTQVIFRSL